ncbi:hypothetical protein CLOM_g9502 [Closterium sp. NIES-68]|nr:hypothetical protein CLOM_g9502 [Closterium sp. NIES-68]GJP69537.1 hypothetical protein CLOP_g541 [Closterium sp. NIES-67]
MASNLLPVGEVVKRLSLQPHPEGGFYAETFRDTRVQLDLGNLPANEGFKVGRPVSTCIYFLLPTGSVSHLHRMPSSEIFHFYAGDPLTIVEIEDDGSFRKTTIGPDLAAGHSLHHIIKPNVWFGAFPTLDFDAELKLTARDAGSAATHYSLVGCTVAPAFEFADFELANRADLVGKFPHLADVITILTSP